MTTTTALDLDAFWMPFTANRQFKQTPRMLVKAEGMHYTTDDGRTVLDGTAGLWCVNAGHCRPTIVEAVRKQVGELDYAPPFQMGHPKAFELATRVAEILPPSHKHVFFVNSGSEGVDTALKIALAYHRVKGEGARQRLIGRERGYHGVGFGGISVGGMVNNRKTFGSMLVGVDHLRHTHDLSRNAFAKGQPEHGVELAEDLERLVALHDASTIAAVIVEPMAGSTGVLLPPRGYLQRLREICDKYGILLIFDEVISGFGRLGAPFAVDKFGVIPDMMIVAKGLTNGTVPMGAVFASDKVHDAFMTGPEGAIELFHGYTYSGHPVAAAAGIASLDLYREERLFERANDMAPFWEETMHSLRGLPNIIDIRNMGLVAGIEMSSIPGKVGARAYDVFVRAFKKGLLIRTTGDIIALSPPLIIEKAQISEIAEKLSEAIKEAA
ncbi:MAG: aspartate aminotransferase family protein [Vicinamibacteria bacterium]|jgi:beta-alanine--pyruvate transaminase|nr:aspartate aminotransferase family protein [Vicinamibacteria bacterium]